MIFIFLGLVSKQPKFLKFYGRDILLGTFSLILEDTVLFVRLGYRPQGNGLEMALKGLSNSNIFI